MGKQKRAAGFEHGTVDGKAVEFIFGPLAVEDIVERLFDEARSDEPDGEEFAFLAQELDAVRLDAAGGDGRARAALRELNAAVEAELAIGEFSPSALVLVGAAFAQAGIEPPPTLKAALKAQVEETCACGAEDRLEAAARAMEADLVEFAAAVDHDPFVIHQQFSEMAAGFEGAQRAAFATGLACSNEASVREAAVGFLLDRDESCAVTSARVLAEEGLKKPVSSATIERLERITLWVQGKRREAIDAVRSALAPLAADGAPSPLGRSKAWDSRQRASAHDAVDVCLATLVDGAGAQSLFARLKTGKRVAIVGVLIKEGVGVADAWVHADLTRKDSDGMLAHLSGSVACARVPVVFWGRRLSDALALNLAHEPPPFGLVQAVEAMGLGDLRPAPIDPQNLIDDLLAGLPEERMDKKALDAAARASRTWDERIGVVEAWFEAGEGVDALLTPFRTRKARSEAAYQHLLKRRAIWARRLAWTAAALKEAQEGMLIADWIDMALMARELARKDDPYGGAPVLMQIAERTVDVFAAGAKALRRKAHA